MAETDLQKIRRLELNDVKAVMESKNGRNFMYRVIDMTGVYRTSYNPEMPDSHTTFKEGGRNVGLFLIAELQEASPALFMKMIEENSNELE